MRHLLCSLLLLLVAAPAFAQDAPCHLVPTSSGGYTLACDPLPTEAHPKLWTAAVTGLGALMFADATMTAYSIASGCGSELNPILAPLATHPRWFGEVKGSIDTAALLTLFKLHENPARRKEALVTLGLAAAMSTAAVVNNQHVLNRCKR